MTDSFENWTIPQKILVILAHPDDPEFFCGATLARWASLGHEIHYLLLTCGDKGGDGETAPMELCASRYIEQHNAARIIGVKEVNFLDFEDGYLVPSLELRKEIVRAIRKIRPDVLVTCDPTNMFPSVGYGINHPDHRAAGQVVLDAVFPAAGNIHFFPELLRDEALPPHNPREVWISLTSQPNVILDVTDFWEIKISALMEHVSQIGDPGKFQERMHSRHTSETTLENPRYEERFRTLVLKR